MANWIYLKTRKTEWKTRACPAVAARDLQVNLGWKILHCLGILLILGLYPPEWKLMDSHSDLELFCCLLGQDFQATESCEEAPMNVTRDGTLGRAHSGPPSEQAQVCPKSERWFSARLLVRCFLKPGWAGGAQRGPGVKAEQVCTAFAICKFHLESGQGLPLQKVLQNSEAAEITNLPYNKAHIL